MSRRADDVAMLSCALSEAEVGVIERMKELAVVGSDANLVRIALWSLADHYGLEMGRGVFDLRTPGPGKQTAPNPRVRQH